VAGDCTLKFLGRPFFVGREGARFGPCLGFGDIWEGTMLAHAGHQALVRGFVVALAFAFIEPSAALSAERVKVAVFDFELNDTSAGGGLGGPDAIDARYLKESVEEAKSMLSASESYALVDTGTVASELPAAGGFRLCNGCDAALARKLGAAQAMTGFINRVSRTEYVVDIVLRDAETGAVLGKGSTGLRMGANYSWPRGVRWLMEKFLAAEATAAGE
jgi:hypothetical protein